MSKIIKLNNTLKTLKKGFFVYMEDGELKSNFNEMINLFRASELNIVELQKIKTLCSRISTTDIYHPHFNILQSMVEKLVDITKLPQVISAYEYRNTEIKGGLENGSYCSTIRRSLNILFQEKLRSGVELCIDKQTTDILNLIEERAKKENCTEEEMNSLKSQFHEEYAKIVQEYNFDLQAMIRSYCIFDNDKIEGKIINLMTVNDAVRNIVLDSEFFHKLYDIQTKERKEALKIGINYSATSVFDKLKNVA